MNLQQLIEHVEGHELIPTQAWESDDGFVVCGYDKGAFNLLDRGELVEGGHVFCAVRKDSSDAYNSPIPEFLWGSTYREIPIPLSPKKLAERTNRVKRAAESINADNPKKKPTDSNRVHELER